MNCKYCNKLCKNHLSLSAHQRLCKNNPNKQLSWLEKQILAGVRLPHLDSLKFKEKQRQIRLSQPPLSEETKRKISIKSKAIQNTPEYKEKHSSIMKEVVLKYPESYSDNNVVGRSKHFTVDGIRYNSTWEYEVAKFLTDSNILWERKGIKPENYYWNNSWHLYFPDFYLPEYDCYIEVKGYETERDREKWLGSSKKVIVLKEKELKLIKEGKYTLILEDKH